MESDTPHTEATSTDQPTSDFKFNLFMYLMIATFCVAIGASAPHFNSWLGGAIGLIGSPLAFLLIHGLNAE